MKYCIVKPLQAAKILQIKRFQKKKNSLVEMLTTHVHIRATFYLLILCILTLTLKLYSSSCLLFWDDSVFQLLDVILNV